MSQLTIKSGFLIILQVLIFSAIFYAIGSTLGFFFADIPLSYINYQASEFEKIVYGGFVILLLGWTILLMIFRQKPKPRRVEKPAVIPKKPKLEEQKLKAKSKPIPKRKAKLRSKDGN